MARKNECEKAIRFISNSIKNYTEPESLERWCDLAKTEAGYDKCADSFSSVISYRLDRIEDLKGYSLMEKVRLVFLFSRPVSSAFVKELKEAKCTVELNDKRKITYFRSPGGDCVLQADQDLNSSKRKFKGKQIQPKPRPIRFIRDDDCEKAIKFISNEIKNYTEPENLVRWCDWAKTEVNYDKSAEAFGSVIKKRLDKIEDLKGYSLKEKVHLVFIFSRPVSPGFLKILKDNKCVVELNDKRRITYFRSEDSDIVLQSEHKKRNFKGKPCTEKKKTTDAQVRSSDNVQGPPSPVSPQILPNPPEMNDVELTKGEEETAPEQEKQEIKAPEKTKEKNKNTSTKQKSILNTEEDVDVMNGSLQQEAPFNDRIDFDDMDNGEYPEFMVPNDDESPNRHNKKHQNPSQENDSEESESEDEAPTNGSDSQNSELSKIQNGPINGRINSDELDKQELEVVTVLKHERSFDGNPEKRPQNSWSSENAKRVKTEEWDEHFFAVPGAREAINDPEESKINVLLLANNIGIIALYCDLEDVQKKASQAIEMIKREEREMTLNVADFNRFIDSMLKSIKRSRIRYSRQTEKSFPLEAIYRHIKLSLILPFGPEIAGKALKLVDKEIEELGESHDEVPLETIRGNLEYLLNSSAGFWI
ncbi:hypothetical protein B9Z55_027792 [Caenorhabditis nigoni]|uniref:SPK domain-containing protein n=1 Tax=Caenorhabditis nigoni TaxID=1611254 RepID=A0A2G5SEQ0_9PELO|nr:hypothetical protein B9Z55_027792 [Caenorhabditis nigoni]